MDTMSSARRMHAALQLLEQDMPLLDGKPGWQAIRGRYKELLGNLEDDSLAPDQYTATVRDLMLLVFEVPAANARLHALVDRLDTYARTFASISRLAGPVGLSNQFAPILEAAKNRTNTRVAILDPKMPGRSKSIKIRNIEFDLGELGGLISGVILGANEIATPSTPLMSIVSLVAIASSIYQAARVDIEAEHAVVLLGMINACNSLKIATEEEILLKANEENARLRRNPVSTADLSDLLLALQEIHVIKKITGSDNAWQLIERVVIAPMK